MKALELRYVAHVTTLTRCLVEQYRTEVGSLRELVDELDGRYRGFEALFVSPQTGQLTLNTMIYYSDLGEIPISAIDLDQPIRDGGTITFW